MKLTTAIAIFWQVFIPIKLYSQADTAANNKMISMFDQIQTKPDTIIIQNKLNFHPSGGHLQGIQKMVCQNQDYYILSGSSDEKSYYSVAKTGETKLMVSHNILLEKPFKHAGGFQLWDNLMAIGVEDDNSKNQSKVFIFRIDNPEKTPNNPLAIIDRIGTEKRVTAGCVAITTVAQKVLIVVGDWDAVHLDFYLIDSTNLGTTSEALELEYSLDFKKIDKKPWIDDLWPAYQNINFLKGESEKLYLVGTYTNTHGENMLDLFNVSNQNLKEFELTKIYTRNFGVNQETKFTWGAGIHLDSKGQIQIMSTQKNLYDPSMIFLYH